MFEIIAIIAVVIAIALANLKGLTEK